MTEMTEAIQRFCEWRQLKVIDKTVKAYKAALISLCFDLQNPQIEDITLDGIMHHFQKLQEFGYDNNGLIVRSVAFRKFLEFYRLQGYNVLHNELIPIPRKEFRLPRVADQEKFEKMLAAIPNDDVIKHVRDKALLSLLWDSGARGSEVLSLQVADLDLERMCNLITTKKNRGSRPFRNIFWTERTNEYLKAWLLVRKEAIIQESSVIKEGDPVFISIRKYPHVRIVKPLRVSSLSYITRQYCRSAGVDYINPHSFRHYMGHKIIKDGGSNSDVANILGHTSLNSGLIYTTMVGKELEERYRKFRS